MVAVAGKKSVFLRMAGIIAIIAGSVIIISGYTAHPFYLTAMAMIEQNFGTSIPAVVQDVVKYAVSILTFFLDFGGFLVVAGGIVLLLKRGFFGRLLIRLGGGMGIFGLIFAIGEAYYFSGFSTAVFHAEYWVGVILAVVAITLSGRA